MNGKETFMDTSPIMEKQLQLFVWPVANVEHFIT